MTTLSPAVLTSSILLPLSSHCAFAPTQKEFSTRLKNDVI
jgi:hypothetical protein